MDVVPMTPISSVKVLRNVPLDNTYKDTLNFTSVSNQISYFTGKAKNTYTGLAPVKLFNAIRMPVNADYLYDCNYIMFQNANFGQKWFYAFISKIEFVNVNMCTLFFEIDVMQTWMFDYTLKPSMVLREHINGDTLGANLVSENVDIGYYREKRAVRTQMFNLYKAVIGTTYDEDNDPGGYIGGMFTGMNYIPCDVDTPSQVTQLKNLLKLMTDANKSESIVSIFMMPSEFYTNGIEPVSKEFSVPKEITKVGNYTPRNKKLLSYPYNFLYVFTTDGANAIYRYEYFKDGEPCKFFIDCAMSPNPEIVLTPNNYQEQYYALDESLTMGGFPQCAYSIDTYRAWLSQNATSIGLSAIGNMASGIANPVSGALGMASTLNGVVMASQRPPMIKGSQGNSTMTGTRQKDFYFVNKHVSEEYARIIDDYFDMYGYAVNVVKTPNVTGRPSWNYVKTQDVKIVGSIPFDDMRKIKDNFNSGITFWHGDWVGDYNRVNGG